MLPLRKELQTYASSCERLLSSGLGPVMTQDEQDLILYYAKELTRKFEGAGQSHYARA